MPSTPAAFRDVQKKNPSLPVVRIKLGQYGATDTGNGDVLHYTQNSPDVAVYLAAHLGPIRIGLIGVDIPDHHFFAKSGRRPLAARLPQADREYGALADALRMRGIELVNLSSISRLRSPPRARVTECDSAPAQASEARAAPQLVSTPSKHESASEPTEATPPCSGGRALCAACPCRPISSTTLDARGSNEREATFANARVSGMR